MKHIGKLVSYLILAVNALFVGLLCLSAFSPYINPEAHPVLSCMGLVFPAFLLINFCFLLFWLIVCRKFLLLPLFGFLVCMGPIRTYIPFNFKTKEVPEGSIKILSYNVMAFNKFKKHTSVDVNPIIEYIQESNADIVCMQEFMFTQDKSLITKKDIDQALQAYPYKNYQTIGDGKVKTNGLACYSKYPILSARVLEYESSYNGSVIYQLNVDGDTITLINNHLESNKLTKEDKEVYESMIKDPKAKKVSDGLKLLITKLTEASEIRARQVQIIAQEIKQSAVSTIVVCGDFNDTPISYAHRLLTEELNDAFTQSGNGLGISYNQNKFYFRIDNILLSKNLKAYNCTVDKRIKDSDHYPIWCYFAKR